MKKIICLILSTMLLFSLLMPVYSASGNIVSKITIAENSIVVEGDTDIPYEYITVAFLKPGVILSDLNLVQSEEEFLEKAAYISAVKTDYKGEYTLTANLEIPENETYTLYVRSSEQKYIGSISDSMENFRFIEFVDYENGKIHIKGMMDFEDTELILLVMKPGKTIEDYKTDGNSAVYTSKNTVSGSDKRFEVELDDNLLENEKYNAYILKKSAMYEAHSGNTVVLQKPEELYVSTEKKGEDVFKSVNEVNTYLTDNLKDVPVDVIIDGGEYLLNETLVINTVRGVDTRIKYMAAPDEDVIFSGSKKISALNFQNVTDEEVLNRVYDKVKDKLVQINLRELGVDERIIRFTDKYDTDNQNSIGGGFDIPMFFLNGNRLKISRWPNSGYANYNTVINEGATLAEVTANTEKALDGAIIQFNNSDKLNKWSTAENMFIDGFLKYTWAGDTIKVEDIDTENKTIELKYASNYGVGSTISGGKRFAVVNLLEEIDLPGEWYIDKESGIMYFYPPYELSSTDIFEVGSLTDDNIRLSGAKNVILQGVIAEKNFSPNKAYGGTNNEGFSSGIEISNESANITIKNCTIKDVSSYGILTYTNDCERIWVDNCRIYNIGQSGISIRDNKKTTLKSSNNMITNCDISQVALNSKGGGANGITVNSTGALVKNNTIHNINKNGIVYQGSENMFVNNELYQTSYETADSGAIYSGNRWDDVGNVVEGNLIHNIGPKEPIGKEVWLVYFDDGDAGNTMRNNILVGSERNDVRAVQIAQGPYNNVNSNTFVNFGQASVIDLSYRAGFEEAAATLNEFPYDKAPFINRYPYLNELASLDITGDTPDYKGYKENLTIKNNLAYNSGVFVNDSNATDAAKWWMRNGYRTVQNLSMDRYVANNIDKTTDIFVNSVLMDFRVKAGENVPEGILTEENFDISLVGKQKEMKEYKEFSLSYPFNGDQYVSSENIVLSWNSSPDADMYVYTVASDANFTNVVKQGETMYTNVEIGSLNENTTYYWKVEGKSLARLGTTWECENVFAFATNTTIVEDEKPSYGNLKATDKNGETPKKLVKGEVVTVTDEVVSEKLASERLVYVFAGYDEQGCLDYTKIKNITVTSNPSPVVIMKFTIPKDTASYKILRWESFKTLKPIE